MRVGVFDSGLGGLTVVDAILSRLDGLEIFYIADTAHMPYGDKSPSQILHYSQQITKHLIEKHQIQALIIACNTATSAAGKALRDTYPDLPIIGIEPGIKPAIASSTSGHIGILATPATLKGSKYQALADKLTTHSQHITLHEQPCHALAELIEQGGARSKQARDMLSPWLLPMKEAGVDTIVLGCTHYPLVASDIRAIMGDEITLIDTGDAIARHLQSIHHHTSTSSSLQIYYTSEIEPSIIEQIITLPYQLNRL